MGLEALGGGQQKSILFEALTGDQTRALRRHTTPVHFPARRTIFAEGEPGETMLLIATGRVEISLTSDAGRRSILAQLAPGDVVGEMAVLDGGTRSADAVAATDVTGQLLSRLHVMRFLRDDPDRALTLVRALCQRLRQTNGSFADHVLSDGQTRLARLMLRLSEAGTGPGGSGEGLHLSAAFSQTELGDMAGLTRETVNRQIRKWEKEGILRRQESGLVLTDPATFRRLANPE